MKLGYMFADNLKYKRNKRSSSSLKGITGLKTPDKYHQEVSEKNPRREHLFLVISLLCFFIISIRLYTLQVLKGSEYLDISLGNTKNIQYLLAERGVIEDLNGEVIARNRPGFIVGLNISKGEPSDELIKTLASILNLSTNSIKDRILQTKNNGFVQVYLKTVFDKEEILDLDNNKFFNEGVFFESIPVRDAVYPKETAHILGYVGEPSNLEIKSSVTQKYINGDKVGKTGLEETYEKYLHGKNGYVINQTDAQGAIIKESSRLEPVSGDTLVLNINLKLQRFIYELFNKNPKQSGAVVVQNPGSGGIIALVSYPSFDVNLFNSYIKIEDYQALLSDPKNPFFNRAIAGQYPPGSTFKIVTATAGVGEKTLDPYKVINVPGSISVGIYTYKDWKLDGHGFIDMIDALTVSSDVYFYAVGGGYEPFGFKGLGIEKIHHWATLYGFGSISGIDISGEEAGLIPTPEWKIATYKDKWYLGDDYITSIGQGFVLVTPLQLNNMTSSVANDGTLYKPMLANKVTYFDEKGERQELLFKSESLRENFIPSEALEILKKGMAGACKTGGTAYPVMGFNPSVACKTGTSEYGIKDEFGKYKTHAWLTLFAPVENPKVALTVFLEGGGEGSGNASKYAREILDWMKQEGLFN